MNRLFLVAALACSAGCAGLRVDYVGNTLPPTSHIDLYFNEEDLTREHVVLGEGVAVAPRDSKVLPSTMQQGLVAKAQANGADAILFTEMKQEYTGTTSVSGYGRSSSQKQFDLIMRGSFLKYKDVDGPAIRPAPRPATPVAPAAEPVLKPAATPAVPAAQPKPQFRTPAPAPAPRPPEDDLDSPATF